MARFDVLSTESAAIGGMVAGSDMYIRLGLMYSSGRSVPLDRVAAHMWFNIAALKGERDAARMRRELSEEMAPEEVAAAQRAAREWLTTH
ncbi:sel1 repeat family protein [Agaricicola taiwanensis]|nr:sel1 repeat family protein [Agaricicola taiwanensis]